MSDRRTKEQILTELTTAQRKVTELEAKIPAPAPQVPVANALAGAIRALDGLAKAQQDYGYGSEKRLTASEDLVGVLKHLLHRYSVDLTSRTVEPCDRPHLEDASDAELIDRIRGFRP